MAAGIVAALLLAIALLWSAREPIARDFVDRALRERNVRASYNITSFGIRSQRLEKIVIGNPAAPDLTADFAEIGIAVGLGGPRLRTIAARGVRLRGRLMGGKLSLGAIDRLLPPPSGAPLTLPDLIVDVDDARMRLDTPYGAVGLALNGRGNLADGFVGKLAAVARRVTVAGCQVEDATAFVTVAIHDRRPTLNGPIRAELIACPPAQIRLTRTSIAVEATLREAFDGWRGRARVGMSAVERGGNRLALLSGRIDFSGTTAQTSGNIALAAESLRAARIGAGRSSLEGTWQVGPLSRLAGAIRLEDLGLQPASAAAIARSGTLADGTPAGPLLRALAPAVAAATRRSDLRADILVEQQAGAGRLRIASAEAVSASGASLRFGGGAATYQWPAGGLRIEGDLALAGGGLPAARVSVRQSGPGLPMQGQAVIAPFAAGSARLALAPVRFDLARDGSARFDTVMTLDGPLADGRIDGLRVPLAGRFSPAGMVIGERCGAMDFSRLSIAGLVIGAARLPLCPAGGALFAVDSAGAVRGGATIAGPRLSGRIGRSPATIAAARLGVTLGTPGFVADAAAIQIGGADSITRLDVAQLRGEAGAGSIAGRFAGAGGNIGNVPLALSDGAGGWRLASGVLTLAGQLRVADRAAAARFRPLESSDVRLRMAGGRIEASGRLVEPATRSAVTDVTLSHDLSSGTGRALLDVPGILFTEAFQPEMLTPLTLGVVANVRGTIAGRGEIKWTPAGATSEGDFRTDGLALAAAFGPVTGLKGGIHFSDLLALATPPGQVVTVAEINSGVAVTDGVVRYQLLPGQRMQVESGRWPFAGGELLLEPTSLDFGRPSERRLTFRIVGMDAAVFVQRFELKNLALTGIFDGVLPMVFDAKGGRIVGGRLAVRRGGGTLAYVGEVSNADLGMFAKLAFDALKSMRYDALAVELDGSLDGELISKVLFNGTNETPKEARRGLLAQLTGLPFRFNITIRAPFRGLLNSAQTINDPRALIGQALPSAVTATPVQPQESETAP